MGALVLGPVFFPAGFIILAQAGVGRSDPGARNFQRIAGDDPHERLARSDQRGKCHHVVFDDYIRIHFGDYAAQFRLAVFGTVNRAFPDGPDNCFRLFQGGFPEFRERLP